MNKEKIHALASLWRSLAMQRAFDETSPLVKASNCEAQVFSRCADELERYLISVQAELR